MLYQRAIVILAIILTGCGGGEPLRYGDQYFRGDPATHTAVTFAKQQIGVPYRFGGNSPQGGFDCSGLVFYSFSRAGLEVPRTTDGLYDRTFPVDPRELRQGDLLFFSIKGKISHVGIYVGNGKFVHAPSSGKSVTYASLSNPYWLDHLVRAGRLF